MGSCTKCKVEVSQKVEEYSLKNMGAVLCFNHQKEAKKEVSVKSEVKSVVNDQRLIVRQTCLKASATVMTASDRPATSTLAADTLIIAEQFEDWVYRN